MSCNASRGRMGVTFGAPPVGNTVPGCMRVWKGVLEYGRVMQKMRGW